MPPEMQLAGFFFSADDWSGLDDETRAVLLAAGAPAKGDAGEFDDEPTLTRGPARAGA